MNPRDLLAQAYQDNGDLGAAGYIRSGHDLTPDTQIALLAIKDALALSQTLPAPGEVERNLEAQRQTIDACANVVKIIREQYAERVRRTNGEHNEDVDAVAVAKKIETAVRALLPNASHATVAAANDEGVAEAFARGVEAAAKLCDIQGGIDAGQGFKKRADAYASAAAAIRLLLQGGGKAERYRHVKRGTEYEVVGRAALQNATSQMLHDHHQLMIYRGDDGKLWAREESEFNDGRFQPLATSRSQHEGADNG